MTKALENVRGVKAATTEFYQALNAMFEGQVSPMEALWSHTDDVTYLGPQGEIVVGWSRVKAMWQEQAALRLGGKIEAQQTHYVQDDTIAYAQCYEIGTNHVQNQTEKVKIRATNIFRKEDGKWKMISHQTDILPFLKK